MRPTEQFEFETPGIHPLILGSPFSFQPLLKRLRVDLTVDTTGFLQSYINCYFTTDTFFCNKIVVKTRLGWYAIDL